MKTDSSPAFALGTRDRNETPTREIALWRIYRLRAGYLLIAVGMGMQKVPAFLHHRPWELLHGVVNSLLLALVLLAVIGLRYPSKKLPLLFWEIAWKATWLLAVALVTESSLPDHSFSRPCYNAWFSDFWTYS